MGRSENYWADKYKDVNEHGSIVATIFSDAFYVFPLYEDSNIYQNFMESYECIKL